MVQQLFSDIRKLQDEIRYLKGRINSISVGNQPVPAPTGIVPISNGGTASQYGPSSVIPVFLNNSGGNLDDGDIVIFDFSAGRRCNLTTTPSDPLVLGAVRGTGGPFGATEETPILVLGYHPVLKVQNAVAAGDYLVTSATSNRAESAGSTPVDTAFAVALTAKVGAGAGVVAAYVFPALHSV